MILSAEHIAKAYLGKVLLQDASLFVEKGDRIGDLYKVYEVDGNGGFVLQK